MSAINLIDGNMVIIGDDAVYSALVKRQCSLEEFAVTLPSFKYVKPMPLNLSTSRAIFLSDREAVLYSVMPELKMLLPLEFSTVKTNAVIINEDESQTQITVDAPMIKVNPAASEQSDSRMGGLFQVSLVSTETMLIVPIIHCTLIGEQNSIPYIVLFDKPSRKICALPFPNIYDDGRVCMGGDYKYKNTPIDEIMGMFIRVFENAPPNNDLFNSDKSQLCNNAVTISPEMCAVFNPTQLHAVSNIAITTAISDLMAISGGM